MNNFEEGDATIVITDALGKKYFTKNISITAGAQSTNAELEINNQLSAGMYFIHVTSSGKSMIEQLFISK